MEIAVTGSTGTLGRQVVGLLAASAGHEVVALARRPGAVAAGLDARVRGAVSVVSLGAVAGEPTRVAGRVVRYTDVAPGVLVEDLARAGEDPWWTYAYGTMFASVRQGRWSGVSDEVVRLTGRVPLGVADVVGPVA